MKNVKKLNRDLMKVLKEDCIHNPMNEQHDTFEQVRFLVFELHRMLLEDAPRKERVDVPFPHLETFIFDDKLPVPAYLVPLLCKTTGRYAALEWLCQLAGCRLVVPTTPEQEGVEG